MTDPFINVDSLQVEWDEHSTPEELNREAEKAEKIAAQMEAEAVRFRGIADHLRRLSAGHRFPWERQ